MRNLISVLNITILLSLLMLVAGCTPIPDVDSELECCGGGSAPSAMANSHVPEFQSVDIGDVPRGRTVEHTFTLRNPTTHPILIAKRPEINYPGLATAEISKKRIEPGGEAELLVTFDTKDRTGPFDLFVRLSTDSDALSKNYHISGFIESTADPVQRNGQD